MRSAQRNLLGSVTRSLGGSGFGLPSGGGVRGGLGGRVHFRIESIGMRGEFRGGAELAQLPGALVEEIERAGRLPLGVVTHKLDVALLEVLRADDGFVIDPGGFGVIRLL